MRNFSQTRGVALLTGGLLTAAAFLPALGLTTARADETSDRRSKQYKTGAAVLGAAAAYFALKSKKPLPAIIAGAGAYYAYKKGKDLKNRDRYGYYPKGYDPNDDRNVPYPNGGGRDDYDNRDRDSEPAIYPDDNEVYADNGNDVGVDNDVNDNNVNDGGYVDSRDAYSQFPDYSSRALTPRRHSGGRIKVK